MTWETIWQSLVVGYLEQLLPKTSVSQTTTIFRKSFTHNFLWGAQDLGQGDPYVGWGPFARFWPSGHFGGEKCAGMWEVIPCSFMQGSGHSPVGPMTSHQLAWPWPTRV